MSKSARKPPRRPSLRTLLQPAELDGIDYRPATEALATLAEWAFALAHANTEEWPDARRRVSRVRQAVLSSLAGRSQSAPAEDVVFTAQLLGRIFAADQELELTEIVSILDNLGLPTDDVPIVPRAKALRSECTHAAATFATTGEPVPRVVTLAPRQVRVPRTATPAAPVIAPCPHCGLVVRFRNAA